MSLKGRYKLTKEEEKERAIRRYKKGYRVVRCPGCKKAFVYKYVTSVISCNCGYRLEEGNESNDK